MKMLTTSQHDKTVVIKLANGVTNALSLELIDELTETLQKLRSNTEIHGIVLGSENDKFFSIGFDLPILYDLPRKDFEIFYRRFNQACLQLYTIPRPTVAAITGHAIAGGCILALCCDYRLMADGRKLIGLNEIKLGVPVPFLADSILRSLVGTRTGSEIIEIGDFYTADVALQMGLVDQVLPIEQVLSASVEKARELGASPPKAFAMIKSNRVEKIEADFLSCFEEKKEGFLECWYSSQARDRLSEAIEKFKA